jgi:SAM-dependent methyltransferase
VLKAIQKFTNLLVCPICETSLKIDGNSLLCDNNHRYRIKGNVIDFTLDSSSLYDAHWSKYESSPLKQYRAKHFVEWATSKNKITNHETVILDLGCGDGNHTQFFEGYKYIGVDISNAIYDVASKYIYNEDFIFIKADAFALPIKKGEIDLLFSFAGINYFPSYGRLSLNELMNKLDRIIVNNGNIALWGAGEKSRVSVTIFELIRKFYKISPDLIKLLILNLGCLATMFRTNSANISILNSPLSHVKEIISTNLTPDYINYFTEYKWCDLTPDSWKLLKEYDVYCGQVFQKMN